MGFIGTETALPDALGLPLGPRGTIQASEAQAYGTGGYARPFPVYSPPEMPDAAPAWSYGPSGKAGRPRWPVMRICRPGRKPGAGTHPGNQGSM